MRLWAITGIGILAVLQGCGGGGGDKTPATGNVNNPGAGGTTFSVVSSTPAIGDVGVPIDATITAEFSGAADPTTINATNVKLLVAPASMADMQHSDDPDMDTMAEIPGDPQYDAAAQQLSFKPDIHLRHGTDFHLVLAKVKSATQLSLPAAGNTIRFSTLNNPEIKSVRYSTTAPTVGQITETQIFTRDSKGRVTRVDEYTGTETTGTLTRYTISGDQAVLPDAPTVKVRSISFDGATAQPTRYTAEVKQGTTTYRVTYNGPGADGKWNQTDDLVSGFSTARESHAGMHWITRRFNLATPAPWSPQLAAGAPTSIQLRELDANGQSKRDVTYSSLGANGEVDVDAATGDLTVVDDVVVSYRLTTRNSAGMRTTRKTFRAPRGSAPGTGPNAGPNGKLFDADDVPLEMDAATYNAMGHRTMDVEYSGPGTDGNWDTLANNEAAEYDLYEYASGTDNLERERSFTTGTNKTIENGAGDDLLRRIETYDPNV